MNEVSVLQFFSRIGGFFLALDMPIATKIRILLSLCVTLVFTLTTLNYISILNLNFNLLNIILNFVFGFSLGFPVSIIVSKYNLMGEIVDMVRGQTILYIINPKFGKISSLSSSVLVYQGWFFILTSGLIINLLINLESSISAVPLSITFSDITIGLIYQQFLILLKILIESLEYLLPLLILFSLTDVTFGLLSKILFNYSFNTEIFFIKSLLTLFFIDLQNDFLLTQASTFP